MFDEIDVSTGFVDAGPDVCDVFNDITEFHEWLKRCLETYPGVRVEEQRYNIQGVPSRYLKMWYDKEYKIKDYSTFVLMEIWIYSKDSAIRSLRTHCLERYRLSLLTSAHDERCVAEYWKFVRFIEGIMGRIRKCMFNYEI